MYSNLISIDFKNLKEAESWNSQLIELYSPDEKDGTGIDYDSIFNNSDVLSEEEEYILTEEINPDDLDADTFIEEFENGKTKIEVGMKDGLKHGTYREYAEEGYIIIKGKFKNDLRDGVWREYDKDGNVIKRMRYKDGEIEN